jgi:hypothetical protein
MDLLSHIGENRTEIIAIPIYGWIRNPVETMIRLLMSTGSFDRWCNKYDILRIFPVNDKGRLFTLTMNYTIDSFYKELKKCGTLHDIDEKDVERDFNEMIMRADPAMSVPTFMDIVVEKLLTESFVENIYIYAPVLTDKIMNFLADLFTFKSSNIYLIEANTKEIIEYSKPKFTTVFIEDTDLFMDVLQSYSGEEKKKYMSDTYYILPAKSSLTESARKMVNTSGVLPDKEPYRYEKFIEAHLAEVNSFANFLQLKMLRMEK